MRPLTKPPQITKLPPFSALVPAWNEADLVEEHIRSFKALNWPGAELILCAGGKDGTYERAKALEGEGVKVLRQKAGIGKQAALRECLAHASHGLFFLTDGDCLYDRKSLEALLSPLASGSYQVATGGSKPFARDMHLPLVQYQACRDAQKYDSGGPQTDGILGRNAAITRQALAKTGNFQATVHTGTDYHMSQQLLKAGIPIANVKESRVESEYPRTASHYLRQWRRWIKNLIVHDFKREWRGIARALVLALAVILSPLFLLWWPYGAVALLAWAPPLLTRFRDLRQGERKGIRVGLTTYLLIPYFTLLDQLAVLGAVWDWINPKRRKRW